jgi:hypothetical protein
MEKGKHRYYCAYCRFFLEGGTVVELCREVNTHNSRSHPTDFASWKENEIVCSCNYSGPGTPLLQYTAPEGGTSPNSFHVTEKDKEFLLDLLVKW